MPWYRDQSGSLTWLPEGQRPQAGAQAIAGGAIDTGGYFTAGYGGRALPTGYQRISTDLQGPGGDPRIPQAFNGSIQDLLAKYGVQQAPAQPTAALQASITPQAIAQPAPIAAQAPAAPQDPASAAIAALKAARASSQLGGSDAQPVDILIQTLEKGASLGMDPASISQAAQTGIGAIEQWQGPDNLGVLRGQISGDARRDNLLSAIGKTQQGLSLPIQAAQEKKEITTQADTQAQEREALRKETLAKIPGLREQLGNELLDQQNYAYSKIAPQIEQRLNAMGILQSGALPEAQTRAFKDLEMARQARLGEFTTGATQNLELNLPYASLGQTQSDRQAALQSGIDLSRAGISRAYQESDLAKAYGQQADMSRLALEEARRAREQANKTGMWQAGIGAAGDITSALIKSSDARLKENIVKIGRLNGVDIVQFHWNETAKSMGLGDDIQVGVIAQEVERLYPEAVSEENGYKRVDYSKLPRTLRDEVERLK